MTLTHTGNGILTIKTESTPLLTHLNFFVVLCTALLHIGFSLLLSCFCSSTGLGFKWGVEAVGTPRTGTADSSPRKDVIFQLMWYSGCVSGARLRLTSWSWDTDTSVTGSSFLTPHTLGWALLGFRRTAQLWFYPWSPWIFPKISISSLDVVRALFPFLGVIFLVVVDTLYGKPFM